ncbi:MAG TPA: cytochrome P450 [Acidimicrobiales bacterium]
MGLARSDLTALALFEGCAAEDLEPVAKAITGVRHVVEGEVVCAEGEKADRCWIVVEGLADVNVGGLYAATIGPGETIGELAVLDGEPRGATVTATTDMVLEEIGGYEFIDALLASPRLSLALLRQVSARLRVANERPLRHAPVSAHPTPAAVAAPPVAVDLDPRAEGYFANPYVQYGALRDEGSVHWSELLDAFLVLRYDDVHRLSRMQSLTGSISTGRPTVTVASADAPARRGRTDKMMIRRDGAEHTRVRRLVQRVFTPRALERWRAKAEQIVERQLAAAAERGEMDVMADYALPLPAQIISEMLGVPQDDIGPLRAWSHLLVSNLEPLNTPEQQEAINQAGRDMLGYLEELIDDKRADPADDILTGLLQAEETGDCLDDEEAQAQVMLLYLAGHETTLNLIGNGVTHLFRHPDQLDQLRTDPSLDANAVEEVLRFESPAQFTRRLTHEPLSIDGVSIPEGSLLMLALAAANHDPSRWGPTAEVLDVARPRANDHLSFGGGPHYCLGANLARMEGQIALPRLIRRFPRMAPAYDEPAWNQRMMLRGVETLPVTLR